MSKRLAILKHFLKSLRAEYVSKRGGSQKTSRVLSVLDVDHRRDRIENSEVDDSIDCHSHGVFGENLLGRHVERDRAQVHCHQVVDTWQNEKQTWTFRSACHYSTESEYDGSLVFLNDLRKTTNKKSVCLVKIDSFN